MRIIQIVICSLFTIAMYAQPLPKSMTLEEKGMMQQYLNNVIQSSSKSITNLSNPRSIAEWEELEGIVIAWEDFSKKLQSEIVKHASQEGVVYIMAKNPQSVKSYLENNNIEVTENIQIIKAEYNSLWIRDYGPNSVYLDDVDSLVMVDWIYNRPRYKDDKLSNTIGPLLNVPVIELNKQPDDLVHTGGNYMCNGAGQAFSSKLVLTENGPNATFGISDQDEDDIKAIMNKYMGIDEYVLMTELPYDEIHHIDMHMKMLDEETLIVGQYPDGVADGPQIEANLQYVLENFKTRYNRPFKVHRITMPPSKNGNYPDTYGDYRTYANALIINKTVLVPIYNTEYDAPALATWQKALPGHKIVGLDCVDIIKLSGAIHCITKEIGAKNPIWITHKSIQEPNPTISSDFEINAIIKHKYEIAKAEVHYSTDGGQIYYTVPLENTATDTWSTNLSEATAGKDSTIYYITAESVNAKETQSPQTGSNGGGWKYYQTIVDTDQIDHSLSVGDIFPNPASAITAIPIDVPKTCEINVELYDILGKKIATIHNGTYSQNSKHVFMQAKDYRAGSYFVKININNQVITRKLIIQ